MKNITKYVPSVCGFNVVFFNDITKNSSVEEVTMAVNDVTRHREEEFFESYKSAQEHLINTLKDNNDYYFGVIVMVWYDFKADESGNPGIGECRSYNYVAEAWAEDEVS